METLSELLRDYRHKNILTQKEASEKLGVTTVTISNIEQRKIKAGPSTLKKIMRESGVDDLLEMVRLNDNNIL